MTDAQAAGLYSALLLPSFAIVNVLALVLAGLHLLALHGRRLLPAEAQRILGWLTFGLLVGHATLIAFGAPYVWLFLAGFTGWFAIWAWRNGRLRDFGFGLIGAGLPWVAVIGLFLVLIRPQPTTGIPDARFLMVAAALIVIGIGVALVIADPGRPRGRPMTPAQKVVAFGGELDRAQRMGPVPAPVVAGFVAGLAASIPFLLLTQSVGRLPMQLAGGVALLVVGSAVWYVATPRRVRDAATAVSWLVSAERRLWEGRLGGRLPRTGGGVRRFVEEIEGRADLRPLRIEVLAVAGRLDEAHAELALLPHETPEDRATNAEYAEFVDWVAGAPEGGHLERLEAELAAVDDAAERLRHRTSLALAHARRAADARDPAALDHLAAIRPELPGAPSYWRLSSSITVIGVFAILAFIGPALTALFG